MKPEGSCHCRKVRFTVEATEPYPFNRCYCSICRKTAGTGGFAINLGAQSSTLSIEGKEEISIYHARLDEAGEEYSEGERHFCRHCGTALWVYDPRWPELVHPHAGAIDTPLPEPPSATHMMLASKPDWVRVDARDTDECFNEYPNESLAEWHRRHAL